MDIKTAIIILKTYTERDVRFERDKAYVKVFVQVNDDSYDCLGWIERGEISDLIASGLLTAQEVGDK